MNILFVFIKSPNFFVQKQKKLNIQMFTYKVSLIVVEGCGPYEKLKKHCFCRLLIGRKMGMLQ